MVPSWQSLLHWRPIWVGNLRRLADYEEPQEIVDLTVDDEEEPEEEAAKVALKCPICLEALRIPVSTLCGHIFCLECLTSYLASSRRCPLCKRNGTRIIRLYI